MGTRILIDGNDGIGKTTLAKRLGKELNVHSYIHLSYNDPRTFGFYNQIIEKDNAIFDRSFMDEVIYSDVFNRPCLLTDSQVNYLHERLKELDVIVIIAHSDEKVYDKKEHPEVIAKEYHIDNYFKDLAKKYNYIVYDTRRDSYKALVSKLRAIIDKGGSTVE